MTDAVVERGEAAEGEAGGDEGGVRGRRLGDGV
jgi:hypothetical protein